MKTSLRTLLSVILILCVSCLVNFELFAQGATRITKSGENDLPSVRFLGLSGSPTASALVKSDLMKCGWFNVVEQGNADYTINGVANSAGIQLRVQGGSSFSIQQGTISNERETAHRAVDKILQKLFNIRGICSYKIAFALEVRPGIKEIYICDFDGSNPQQITRNQSISIEPTWGPRNQSILYTLYSPTQTFVGETILASRLSRRLSQLPGMNACPAMNPNGSAYACTLSKDGGVELYVRPYAGRTAQRITRTRGTEASPVYSPDGRQICFVTDNGSPGRPYLCRVPATGGAISRISTIGSQQTAPDWSYDNKIAYAAVTNQGMSICVTDLNGTATKGVGIIVGGGFESPSWAPDNRHLVCQQTAGRRTQLWVIDTWTGKKRLLVNTRSNTSVPAWQKQ